MSGVPYHAWTHRPKEQGGTDPIASSDAIPWARVSKGSDAANQTVASGSFHALTCNHNYNMGSGESGEPYFNVYNNGVNDVGIRILEPGFYLFTAEVLWWSTINNAWKFGFFFEEQLWDHQISMGGSTATTNNDMAGLVCMHHRMNQILPQVITCEVMQLTGGNRDVDMFYMEIARLGTWTGTDYEDMNPPQ